MEMKQETVIKGILRGLQIPFFSPGPLLEELFYHSDIDDEKLKKQIDEIHQKIQTLSPLDQTNIISILTGTISGSVSNDIKRLVREEQKKQLKEKERFKAEIIFQLSKFSDNLSKMISSRDLRATLHEIRSIPLSEDILSLMNEVKEICKEKNIPFHSINLLLLLFDLPNSLIKTSIEHIERGLGDKIHTHLNEYVKKRLPEKLNGLKYKTFDWSEFDWLQIAQEEAYRSKYPVITEKHLLLGLFHSESKAIQAIKKSIGDQKYEELYWLIIEEPGCQRSDVSISCLGKS